MCSLRKIGSPETLDPVSCRQEEEGGCFRRQLLIDRDNLSTDSNDSFSEDLSRHGGTNDPYLTFSFKHTSPSQILCSQQNLQPTCSFRCNSAARIA